MTPAPDPVDEPEAYRTLLLEELGADDPAQVQEGTTAAFRELIAEAGSDLRTVPAPGEWSVLGCITHLVDAEVVMSGRYRWVLAQDQPELAGYDQDLWVQGVHPAEETPDELVALFQALRAANLALWRWSTADQRSRIGIHSERGPESYELMFRMIAGHDRVHLAQARRALEAVRIPS